MRVAVIGGGIAGLGCAYALTRAGVAVTLYEAQPRLGGHTHTVDVTLEGRTYPVDTGFLVFNERTYPRLTQLFRELRVPVARSEMSFSVSVPLAGRRLEWAGSNLPTVFAQRRNLMSPPFLRMLLDLLRFNRAARALLERGAAPSGTLGQWLDAQGFGAPLRDWYLLPMAGAIWSCPTQTMLEYPVATFLRFCHNHGLLQINGRPPWYTVAGGARQYVERIAAQLADVRCGEPVRAVTAGAARPPRVTSARGTEVFDAVVLACHSDQALRLLHGADAEQRALLAAVRYQPNRAWLHTDAELMPRARRVWSAWNYLSDGAATAQVSVTYWLNRLQPLPFSTPLFVSLNPPRVPAPQRTLAEIEYEHPVFDQAAIDAQRRLPAIQGRHGVWFAGAWTGYGFHEDGLRSGQAVAAALAAQRAHALRRAA
ncbi:MAG: FAD-dependent oxidoreductase [Burkholderiaceae bacterium]|nr:FAD-dependent oxidoreductase [Burkholderiaceae bacterium]